MKLHDFLVEHAKFPFPHPTEAGSTDVSQFEVGLLEGEWKAGHAVPDDTFVQKLCQTLEDVLENMPLAAGAEDYLLASFSPQLQVDERGREDEEWDQNPSEIQVSLQTYFRSSFGLTLAQSRSLLDQGFFQATRKRLGECDAHFDYRFKTAKEQSVEGGSPKVDYVALVNDEPKALVEATSPSVMKKVLPPHGIELK